MTGAEFNRFIEVFDLGTEKLIERIPLPKSFDLDQLRALYKKKPGDLDYFYMDGYNVTEAEREFFEKTIGRQLHLNKYCYQLVSEEA